MQRFQERTAAWVIKCFGHDYLFNKKERAMRLLEEAAEASQVIGLDLLDALQVVNHVYRRPVGEIGQELAGVGVTLNALATACDVTLDQAIETELQRIEAKDPEVFRQRNREKAAAGVGLYPQGRA